MLGLTAKKPSPVIARSSDDSDWTRLPWLNCWRIDFTTVPEPIILVGLTDTLDAMTSANSVSERLKPLVETFARLCAIVDISVCEALRRLRLRTQQLGEFAGTDTGAVPKTLDLVAATGEQILFLLLGLDAFGNDADIKAARHRDDRIDDRGVGGIVGDVANERAVDLDLVDRKAGQVRKTRIAGAEVVDDDRDTEPAQGAQDFRTLFRALHQHALGDLQLHAVRRESGLVEYRVQKLRQRLLLELAGRDVDRESQHTARLSLQFDAATACIAQHPFAE